MRSSFAFRLVLFSLFLIVLAVGLSSFVVYQQAKDNLEKSLGTELSAIVNSSAPLIDGDLHERVGLDENSNIRNVDTFEQLRKQLVDIKTNNKLGGYGSPVYTLRKTKNYEANREVEFVIMTDRDYASGEYIIGNLYKAEPHNVRSFNGELARTGIYGDAHGIWISASAPIHNAAGEVVAILQADRPVHFFYSEARAQAAVIIQSALVAILLAGILAVFFAKTLTRPLKRLSAAAARIGSGDLSSRVAADRKDEIGDLGRSFNQMAEDLLAAKNKDERTKKELIKQHDIAEAASRAKSDFLATMSHELRTPINGISGTLQALQRSEKSFQKIKQISMALSSTDSLLTIINEMLDFAKGDAGELKLHKEWISFHAVALSAFRTVAVLAADKGLELLFDVHDDVPHLVYADRQRFRQIIINLVGNAVKFTESGSVTLAVRCDKNEEDNYHLRCTVRDTGVGMAPDQLKHIFEAFAQVDNSDTREHGGTGLGLSISKQLVELMGGEIWAESTPGTGTEFHFTVVFEGSHCPLVNDLLCEVCEEIKGILVVENQGIRQVLIEFFRQLGVTVVVVDNLSQAQVAFSRLEGDRSVHFLLLDIPARESDLLESNAELEYFSSIENLRRIALLPENKLGASDKIDERTWITVGKPLLPSALIPCLIGHLDDLVVGMDKDLKLGVNNAAKNISILAIDDVKTNLEVLKLLLEPEGYNLTCVSSAIDALKLLEDSQHFADEEQDKNCFDIILVDIQMPEMSGTEFLATLREREQGTARKIPVIAVTAKTFESEREQFIKAGMEAVVCKPVDADELYEVIERYVCPIASTAMPIIDKADLLKRCRGKESLMIRLIASFLEEVPALMTELESAVAEKQAAEVQSAAHALKGSLLNIGAVQAGDTALLLENMGDKGELDGSDELIKKLLKEMHLASKHLELLQNTTGG